MSLIKKFFFISIIFITGCMTNQTTFTPEVIQSHQATSTQEIIVLPTETVTEPSESEPTEVVVATTEISLQTVSDFPDVSKYNWREFASGFSQPVGMTSFIDNGLVIYVVQQGGLIMVFENGETRREPFLDIREKVTRRGSEQGLLGIALDPNYLENGIFYVNYTNVDGDTVIARYSASEDLRTADPNSEQIIFTTSQPYQNHNGGNLVFGPDGFLYIGLGDGGSGGDPETRAQNPSTVLGKMLRLVVQDQEVYAVPNDNPYIDGSGSSEVWAIGLRNPWRYSFDRLTGDLWIADVGQGDWEEINYVMANPDPGLNFGWNFKEGTHPFRGEPTNPIDFVDPVFEYDHSVGCSVTGGYVYRGEELPEWYGVYIFGDYCSGIVWGLLPSGDGTFSSSQLFSTGLNISSFGEDVFGEIYLVDYNGSIYKLTSN
jgi:glucose/arabinose dehydrogenase